MTYQEWKEKHPDTLYLILKKEWFDVMKTGAKKVEFRRVCDYWNSRLAGDKYTHVWFNLGYDGDAPAFVTEFKGMEVIESVDEVGKGWVVQSDKPHYKIKLGRILFKKGVK